MRYVYAIHAPVYGVIKIGYSGNPEKRRKDLQSYHRTPLVLLAVGFGDCQEEAAYHDRLADRVADVVGFRSREWFRDCRKVRAVVRDIPIRGKRLEEEFAAFLAAGGLTQKRPRIENAAPENVVTSAAV